MYHCQHPNRTSAFADALFGHYQTINASSSTTTTIIDDAYPPPPHCHPRFTTTTIVSPPPPSSPLPMAATCIPRLRPQPPQQDHAVPRHNGRGRMGGVAGATSLRATWQPNDERRRTTTMSSFVVVLYVFMLDNSLTPSALANQ